MKKVRLIGFLCIFFTVVGTNIVAARDRTDVIYSNQGKGWFLDPGDILTVYYYPDGLCRTIKWYSNWFFWWKLSPVTAIEIYCADRQSGPWYSLYKASVDPIPQKFNGLWLGKGIYKFVIKNFKNGDMTTLVLY